VISTYLFGKSLNLIDAADYSERVDQMRSFTRGIWVAIHFQFIRVIMSNMPQWVIALSADAWLKTIAVSSFRIHFYGSWLINGF
jgi:hypothetical protein